MEQANWLIIPIAAFLPLILGFIWYIFQLFFMDPELINSNSEYTVFINEFMGKYGNRHRSFGHGMVHGAEAGLIFGLALLGITSLMQNKPLKFIWIHLGFWILCCSLMAGLTCTFF